MHVQSVWSLNLGSWGRLHVRLHMLFIVFAVCTVYLAWLGERAPGVNDLTGVAWVSLSILFISGLLHGVGHFLAVADEDEEVELILGPFGEMSHFPAPYDPRSELALQLAGPLVNLSIVLLAAAGLLILHEPNLLGLLHPLAPTQLVEGSFGAILLKLTLWVNWLMLLANVLIPAYPFDGGRILRAAVWGAWPDFGRRWAGFVVYCFAQAIVFGLLVCAWVFREQQFHGVLPIWLALTLLAVFVFFSARQEAAHDLVSLPIETPLQESFHIHSMDDEPISPPARRQSSFSRWLEQRRLTRLLRQQQREAEEELRVDDILRRVHMHGIDQLSPDERAILQRVSDRFRDRMENHVP